MPWNDPLASFSSLDASSLWIKVETSLSMAAESEGRLAGDGVDSGDSGFLRLPVKREVWRGNMISYRLQGINTCP